MGLGERYGGQRNMVFSLELGSLQDVPTQLQRQQQKPEKERPVRTIAGRHRRS